MYDSIKLSISPAQQKKLIKGQSVRILKTQIGNGSQVWLHPTTIKKLKTNKSNGTNIKMTEGEIVFNAEKHGINVGSGFFGDLWQGVKKVGSFLKDSGIASTLADAAATAAVPFVGPGISSVGRTFLRQTTGVGISERMANVRAGRKSKISVMPASGGSFLIN